MSGLAGVALGASLPGTALSLITIADALNNDPSTVAGKLQELGLNSVIAPAAGIPAGIAGALGAAVAPRGHKFLGAGLGSLLGGTAAAVPLGMYMLNDGSGGGQPAQAAQPARTARA